MPQSFQEVLTSLKKLTPAQRRIVMFERCNDEQVLSLLRYAIDFTSKSRMQSLLLNVLEESQHKDRSACVDDHMNGSHVKFTGPGYEKQSEYVGIHENSQGMTPGHDVPSARSRSLSTCENLSPKHLRITRRWLDAKPLQENEKDEDSDLSATPTPFRESAISSLTQSSPRINLHTGHHPIEWIFQVPMTSVSLAP
jgi:hypothetical protein